MIEGTIIESGEEDAYGHKKLGGIGEITAGQIKKYTGSHTIYQSLAYLMRSGEPDALDRMVALSFAGLAVDMLTKKKYGVLTALHDGKYTVVPVETITQGKRVVDVKELYDAENYRPKIFNVMHKPMFLY
jgi:6-phosphofructokinase 1